MSEPTMTATEAADAIAAKTAPKVTAESIKAKIHETQYIMASPTMTLCTLTMANGFVVVGKAAAASIENFDQAIGQRLAYDDAFRQLWAFEGYLLREELSKAGK